MVKKHIVPAILVKSRKELLDRLKRAEKHVSRVQVDIVDGKFAKNKTIGPKSFKGIRTKLKLEIQLMVRDVDKYVDDFIRLKPWMIIFSIECCKDPEETIKKIKKANIKVGISLNPRTSAVKIKPFLKKIDLALVMTIHPGFMGRPFIPKMLAKIRLIRTWDKKIDIEVDGGIHLGTACLCARAGANVFVSGSFIYKAKDIKKAIQQLKDDVRCMT